MTTSVPFDLPPDEPPAAANGTPELEKSERTRVPPKGGGRGGQQETKREVPTAGAPKPPNKTVVDFAQENWSNPDAWPKNGDALWPLIIGHLAKEGVGPDGVVVHVSRRPIGLMNPEKDVVKLGTIRGDSIAPYGGMSASEAQFFYILNTFHCIPAPGCGKAHYDLDYRYAVNGAPIRTGTLELDSYTTLRAIAQRTEEIGAEIGKAAQAEASGQPAGRPPPIMSLPGQPSYFASPAQVPAGMSPEGYMELGHLRAMKEEFERARAEGRAPREVPMPGSPSSDAAIAWEREKAQMQLAAEKDKKELELRIKEMEMKQAADAAARERDALLNRLASLEARINSPGESDEAKMLKHLIALGVLQVGPDGKPVPVGAGASYTPPGPHTEIVERDEPEKKEPTWIDKVIGVAGGILEGAVKNPEGPLTALATFTKGSQAGQMFEGLAAAAAAGKAAVNMNRVSPPSGGGGFKSNA
jgi:hypothetical protein